MISDSSFDFLSARIIIDSDCPWNVTDGPESLIRFFEDPNGMRAGSISTPRASRILCHETLHFWQILASDYLANLVILEWSRVKLFESTGVMLPRDAKWNEFLMLRNECGFSAFQLMESWARFWDVHMRGPHHIIDEEEISINFLPEGRRTELTKPCMAKYLGKDVTAYTIEHFSLVMTNGIDCAIYGAPYRWLLGLIDRTLRKLQYPASAAHTLACTLFPFMVHTAFGYSDPISFFCKLAYKATNPFLLANVSKMGAQNSGNNIGLSWLTMFDSFERATLVAEVQKELQFSGYQNGFRRFKDNIECSPPTYSMYLGRIPQFLDRRYYLAFLTREIQDPYIRKLTHLPIDFTPDVIFCHPGLPDYRLMLAEYFSPPVIQFANARTYGYMQEKVVGSIEVSVDASFERTVDESVSRVQRFRRAETAAELGLPLNSFES